MPAGEQPSALAQWNEHAREKTEDAIVSSMFEAVLNSSSEIEKFSTWLMAGAAAIASFFIVNGDKLIPYISSTGYKWCAILLCASCGCGFISKVFSVFCLIGIQSGNSAKSTFEVHIKKYEEEELRIQETGRVSGIAIETGIRIEKIMEKFLAPMPRFARWKMLRNMRKNRANIHAQYLANLPNLHWQGAFAVLQSLTFLAFLGTGFYFTIKFSP